MDLSRDLEGGDEWPLPENMVRRLWSLAKMAEWGDFNWKWRQRCCPTCGGPESYREHAPHCIVKRTISKLESMYPQVTQPVPMDPVTELEAKAFERLLLGDIQDAVREDEEPGQPRPFWRE